MHESFTFSTRKRADKKELVCDIEQGHQITQKDEAYRSELRSVVCRDTLKNINVGRVI